MAFPLGPSLTPSEVAFLCEMETVTVIPRQRLDGLELLGGPTQTLNPPFPAPLPLWLALLLKRQKRANISPPPWLSVESLTNIYEFETDDATAGVFSPPPTLPPSTGVSAGRDEYLAPASLESSFPFIKDTSTTRAEAGALPYHWLELSHILLTHAPDDFEDVDAVRRIIRDLREVRMSKLRKGLRVLGAGAGIQMNGVGGMEVAEVRGFITAMVDQLRRLNHSREESRKEQEGDDAGNGYGGGQYNDDDDDDDEMQL